MAGQQQNMVAALCLVVVLGALGVAAWALIAGQLEEQGMDGLFLVVVCLVIAAVFSPIPLDAARHGVLGDLLKRRKARSPAEGEPEARN